MGWDYLWSGPRRGQAWIEWCNGHPVSRLVGLEAVESTEHEMSFRLAATELPNPNGSVHGGVLAAALDNALAVTAMLAMPDDGLPNTANMNVQYLRPAMAPLEVRTRVTRGGRVLVFTRADVLDAAGNLCATADGTFAILSPDRVGLTIKTADEGSGG